MRGVLRTVAVAAMFVAGIMLVGCDADVPAAVLVLGDSLSVQAADDYAYSWVDRDMGYLPQVNAVAGAGLCPDRLNSFESYWKARVAALLGKVNPGIVLVELGTNDSHAPDADCQAQYGQYIDLMMNAIGDHPVMWENVNADRAPGGAAIDAALADAVGRWPNLQVLDFNAHFAGHSEWYPTSATDVHPNGAGQVEEATWLLKQLDAYIKSTTSTTSTTQVDTTTSTSEPDTTTTTIPEGTTTTLGP